MAKITKNFKNRATHHPNQRLLLGIAAIGILVLAAIAILGSHSEAQDARDTAAQTATAGQ